MPSNATDAKVIAQLHKTNVDALADAVAALKQPEESRRMGAEFMHMPISPVGFDSEQLVSYSGVVARRGHVVSWPFYEVKRKRGTRVVLLRSPSSTWHVSPATL
jgi:hypothetical protein